jgi:Uncharacterised nucleotidyltransferase
MHAPAPENVSSLLLCARPQVDDETAARIRALAKKGPDWEALLALAAEHSLTPIVCKNLETHAGDSLAGQWRQRFREELVRISCRNLALSAELLRVLQALESGGVNAIPYKGPVLAAQAYGDVGLREFADLDIIIPQAQIATAHASLAGLGYRSLLAEAEGADGFQHIPGQYAYAKDSETMVELHTECTLRYFPRGLDLRELCKRRECVNLAGRQVLTFSREETFLLLCVHGSKHIWERLGWIADIAALMKAARPVDWEFVLGRARKSGIQRMVLLGAGLAAQLFGAELPNEVAECLKRDAVARRLIAAITQRFFSATQAQLGVFGRFAFRVRIRGSLIEGLPYALRLAMTPTELDRGRHARFLEPLYALRRPLRLARTYGWRTQAGR